MLDVILINPPTTLEARYGALAEGGSRLPPLGLALLAAIAREAGFSVRVIDAEALGLDADTTARMAAESQPRVVGLTAVTMAVHAAAEVAAAVKAMAPGVLTLLGGVHVTALPEATLNAFPAFDVGVVGEGDATLPELLAAVREGASLDGVAGLMLRDAAGGLRRTETRGLVQNLDSLPMPAWDLLPDFPGRYRPAPNAFRSLPSSSLVSSRGCPGRCTFCDRAVSGHRLRSYSATYLMRMVRTLHDDHGVRDIIFHDDNFVASRERLAEFCEQMEQAKLGIEWSCTGRIDMVSQQSLAAMKRAGCWQIAYGVESGSQEILDSLCKGITLDRIREVVRWTRDAGIEPRGYFMIGTPGETPRTLRETIDFLLELPLDDFHMTVYTPFAGTPLGDEVLARRTATDDWRRYGDWEVVYVPDGTTAEALTAAQKEAFRRFYVRPRIIIRYVGRLLRRPRIAGALFSGLRAWVRHVFARSRRSRGE